MMTNDDLDRMLAEHRPDRYEAGDISWTDAVADAIAEDMTVTEARTIAAHTRIKRREEQATRKANRLLRHYANAGALPLDWMDLARWPVDVGAHRVCLNELNAEDLRQFERGERDAADRDYAARLDTCKGALMLADAIEAAGVHTVGELMAAIDLAVQS